MHDTLSLILSQGNVYKSTSSSEPSLLNIKCSPTPILEKMDSLNEICHGLWSNIRKIKIILLNKIRIVQFFPLLFLEQTVKDNYFRDKECEEV